MNPISAENMENATSPELNDSSARDYSLKNLLFSEDHDEIDRFRDFLRMEFSDETLDFWLEVEDYKALVGSPGAARMAKRIFSTYIDDQAPREINTEKKIKDEIKSMIATPTVELFDRAQKDVFRLIEKGPYVRFVDRQANATKPE